MSSAGINPCGPPRSSPRRAASASARTCSTARRSCRASPCVLRRRRAGPARPYREARPPRSRTGRSAARSRRRRRATPPPRPAPPASAGAGGGSAPDLAQGDGAPAARYADADAGATPPAGRFRLGPSADGGDAVGVVVTPDDGAHSRIYEGTLLPAALQTQIQGAYSGPISAQITRHVYSRDRQRVLVPRGTVALGRSGSVTGPFQDRLAVSFHRLIFPDGRWVRLDFTGLSSVGETSLRDQVNRHYVSTFGTAGAIGLLAGLSTAGQESPFMGTMSQQMANLSLQLLSHYMNRRPEVTIRAGHRVNIRLTSDVIVPDYAAWEPR